MRNLLRKLRKRKVRKDLHPTPLAPPASGDEGWWSQLSRGSGTEQNKGVCFRPVHMVAPVMEVPDTNNPGQIIRQHLAIQFKEMKQLKEAVAVYGAQAPFTLAMVESFSAMNLTPSDWQQLCRAVLSGGDDLLCEGNIRKIVSKRPS